MLGNSSHPSFQRNIPLIYATSALMWGRFFVPVIALFYIASQVSVEEFAIIMSVFSLVILLLEIPSGAIADHLGYRKTLILSRSFYLVEILLLAFTNGFVPLLIAKIISGVGVSLTSGTSSGLLYETLKELGEESSHKKYSGINLMITQISMGVTFIVGAFLFSLQAKLPALASLPFIFTGWVLTFFLKEPTFEKPEKFHLLKHLRKTVALVNSKVEAKFLTLYAFFTAGIVIMILTISSAYLEAVSVPIPYIGFIALIAALTSAAFANRAERLEAALGEKYSLVLIYGSLMAFIVAMSLMNTLLGVLAFILIQGVYGFYQVVTDNYMNVHSSSKFRVAMLSVRNMAANLSIVLVFPFVGRLARIQGYTPALLLVVVAMIVGAIVIFWYTFSKHLRFNKNISQVE